MPDFCAQNDKRHHSDALVMAAPVSTYVIQKFKSACLVRFIQSSLYRAVVS